MDHFHKFFESEGEQNLNEVFSSIPKQVDDEINLDLTKQVSNMEIKEAMLSLGALKAPRSDGLRGIFYRNHCDVVDTKVCEVVKLFF